MSVTRAGRAIAVSIGCVALLAAGRSGPSPAGDVAALTRAWLALDHPPAWDAMDRLPGIRWAAPQPTSLTTCLPDGGCYTRQGTATLGGRAMAVIATGARTMVTHLYLRNTAAPVGEAALLGALRQAGLTPTLARCPVAGGAGTTRWYRLAGSGVSAGVLSVQGVQRPRPSEGFALTAGTDLPQLQPNQLPMYTEQCAGGAAMAPAEGGTAPAPVPAAGPPHRRLAEVVVALLVPAGTRTLGWQALPGLGTGIEWDPAGPRPANLSYRNDPNPMMQSGTASYGGRRFSVQASGTAAEVRIILLEEQGRHPRGEHMLGEVYNRGITVRLVRCGPVYTESTNNWYSLSSTRTRPAMIRQSIHYEGNNVADTYELRLDASLPARDPRDRDPGVGGCQ